MPLPLLAVLAIAALRTAPEGEPVQLPVLDGGAFDHAMEPDLRRVAWWRTLTRQPVVEDGALVLEGSAQVAQPFALHEGTPFTLTGELVGHCRLVLVDGAGGAATIDLASEGEQPLAVQLDSAWFTEQLGRAPQPRYAIHLSAVEGQPAARWLSLAITGAVDTPDEPALRADVVAHIDRIVATYVERSLDRVGPRPTAFVVQFFDADTGEPAGAPQTRVGFNPLYDQLLHAYGAEPRDAWRAALEPHLDDYLALCLHPATGLPRNWDPVADRPADAEPVEIAVHLRFLLDAAAHGPESHREPALAAAQRIGEQVLARGVLPTGQVAAKYRPSDGEPYTDTVLLRRLDVPAQLARLGAVLGDERHRDVAREAVRELEYAHHWPGTWDRIDPGFDDDYGHYGERAVTMWEAWPEEAAFRDLALSGWRTYAPLWRRAVRHGGNVAADQVRCWRIAVRLARLAPELAPDVTVLLDEAARLHFKGGQGNDGTWVDVTIFGFDPQRLPVGDTAGVPHNLLEGLGVVYGAGLGLDTPDTRARFVQVLRATDDAFGGRYGYISGGRRLEGAGAQNPAIGSIRLFTALVDMLLALSPAE